MENYKLNKDIKYDTSTSNAIIYNPDNSEIYILNPSATLFFTIILSAITHDNDIFNINTVKELYISNFENYESVVELDKETNDFIEQLISFELIIKV